MALNRDKFRKIVGGITTAEPEENAVAAPEPKVEEVPTLAPSELPSAEQGVNTVSGSGSVHPVKPEDNRRFAKRGRPKGAKPDDASAKGKKVKVSLFLSEVLVNDLYDWAHDDRIHPGEMFERALKPFHEREAKRRNAGKG